MKYGLFAALILFSCNYLYSQNTAQGYYIIQANDTIKTQIKLKRGIFNQLNNNFADEFEILEDDGTLKKFTPITSKGYGFSIDNTKYQFVSKPTKKGSAKFLTPLATGPKTSLYQYKIVTSGGVATTNSTQVFYTFEKSDGTYLFLKNMLNKNFRAELKAFYEDNAKVQELIDTKLKYWLELKQDLIDILKAANK